jgi:hypothetical protein
VSGARRCRPRDRTGACMRRGGDRRAPPRGTSPPHRRRDHHSDLRPAHTGRPRRQIPRHSRHPPRTQCRRNARLRGSGTDPGRHHTLHRLRRGSRAADPKDDTRPSRCSSGCRDRPCPGGSPCHGGCTPAPHIARRAHSPSPRGRRLPAGRTGRTRGTGLQDSRCRYGSQPRHRGGRPRRRALRAHLRPHSLRQRPTSRRGADATTTRKQSGKSGWVPAHRSRPGSPRLDRRRSVPRRRCPWAPAEDRADPDRGRRAEGPHRDRRRHRARRAAGPWDPRGTGRAPDEPRNAARGDR